VHTGTWPGLSQARVANLMTTEEPGPTRCDDSAWRAIEVRDIRHSFDDARTGKIVQAVAHADIQIRAGEFVSIVGPSGCGKTTLLNIISGLTTPTHGTALVNGRPVLGVQPQEIGYMFARDTLLPWRTVAANVGLALEFRGITNRDERVHSLLDVVGLTEFAGSYPDQLSQGMRQRVALARTLAPDPAVLLMDEPFGALDAQTKLLMEEEFLRIWEADQKTVLFVTHDLDEALILSDRILVMSGRPGRIKAEYTPEFPRPRNAEVLRGDRQFVKLVREIWQHLKSENVLGGP
jgi:NitT/TauT family transport system ATP-binding protein